MSVTVSTMLRIGQAVVTDPSSGRASGYVLVAASESVRAEDAQHLTAAPQVTDYLHLEKSPGPFFSFYPLPSGSWAAVKRFVRGTRRGAFNRAVVHTLVVPPEALRDLADEPWLLWTRCRFRAPTGGAVMTSAELTESIGDPELDRVADLELVTDDDPRTERATLLENRRDFLRRRWSADELAEHLRSILAARISGRRVLLPQGTESEQLLAVAGSLMPAADRLRTPWTTHLAPSAGGLFQLAACPDPRAFQAAQDDPSWWVLPLDEPVPDDAEQDGRTLADALASGELDLRELDDGFRSYRIRFAAPGQTRRWIAWLQRGGERLLEGLVDASQLADLFHDLRLRPGDTRSDPWLRPSHFLGCACGSVLRMVREGYAIEEALADVLQVLVETHWHAALLTPEVIGELTEADAHGHGPENVPVAVAFALHGLAAPPGGREEREVLLDLLMKAPPPRVPREHPLFARVLLDLGFGLARCRSPRAESTLIRLASIEGGLALAVDRLAAERRTKRRRATPQGEAETARVLLRAAGHAQDEEIAARLAVEHLFPLLLDDVPLLEQVPGGELAFALEVLRHRPAFLATLLRHAPAPLYDAAAAELRRWAEEGLDAARAAAEALLGDLASVDDPGDPFRRRPSIAGLAEGLARLAAPARTWLPFALAEAELGERFAEDLAGFLGDVHVPRPEARELIDDVLDSLRRAIAETRLDEGHRTLLEAVRSGAAAQPEKTVAALAKLAEVPTPAFLRWSATVAGVAEELERSAPYKASALRGNYWRTLAGRHWESFPSEAVRMLPGLRGHDRRQIAELWLPKIGQLKGRPGETELVSALAPLVDKNSSEQKLHYNVGRLRLALACGELDLDRAVAQVGRAVSKNPADPTFVPHMKRALQKLLPSDPQRRALAVLGLLFSPSILPSIKRVMETELCEISLSRAGDGLAGLLPSVTDLAARGGVLLQVAACLGEQWQGDPAGVRRFLREAVKTARFDAVAAFLSTSERRVPGFLARLAEGDASLVRSLSRAADDFPIARLYLRPYLEALRAGMSAAVKRRRR